MAQIQNLTSFDPFADAVQQSEQNETMKQSKAVKSTQPEKIHLRIQKRNGRKSITTISGLNRKFNFKKILKAFKKEFCCNGSLEKDEGGNQIIQLAGDHREEVMRFFLEEEIVTDKNDIVIHGF